MLTSFKFWQPFYRQNASNQERISYSKPIIVWQCRPMDSEGVHAYNTEREGELRLIINDGQPNTIVCFSLKLTHSERNGRSKSCRNGRIRLSSLICQCNTNSYGIRILNSTTRTHRLLLVTQSFTQTCDRQTGMPHWAFPASLSRVLRMRLDWPRAN